MIRSLLPSDFDAILKVINDAARAYRGVIPDDRWKEPAGYQRKGIGTGLLEYLVGLAKTPEVLVGTWADATWAIRFYEKHGFKLVSSREKDRLLRTYWSIPQRQVETSVVLRTISSF